MEIIFADQIRKVNKVKNIVKEIATEIVRGGVSVIRVTYKEYSDFIKASEEIGKLFPRIKLKPKGVRWSAGSDEKKCIIATCVDQSVEGYFCRSCLLDVREEKWKRELNYCDDIG